MQVVSRFPTETSALLVIYGILTIVGAKWRGVRFDPATVIKLQEAAEQLQSNPIMVDLEREAA